MARGKGETVDAAAWYDGATFTVRQAEKKLHAQASIPPNIDEFLDYIETRIAVRMPMADLFYASPLDSYIGPETSGRVVGQEEILGMKATHLALRDPAVDFDIWIQDGDKPLPVELQRIWLAGPAPA